MQGQPLSHSLPLQFCQLGRRIVAAHRAHAAVLAVNDQDVLCIADDGRGLASQDVDITFGQQLPNRTPSTPLDSPEAYGSQSLISMLALKANLLFLNKVNEAEFILSLLSAELNKLLSKAS